MVTNWKTVLIGDDSSPRRAHLTGALVIFTVILIYYIVIEGPMVRRGVFQIRFVAIMTAFIATGIIGYRQGGIVIGFVVSFSAFLPSAVEWGLFLTSTPLPERIMNISRQIIFVDLRNTIPVGMVGFGAGTALRVFIQS